MGARRQRTPKGRPRHEKISVKSASKFHQEDAEKKKKEKKKKKNKKKKSRKTKRIIEL